MSDRIDEWAVRPIVWLIRFLSGLDRRTKRAIVIGIDALLCISSVWIAYSLRLGQWNLLSPGIGLVTVASAICWYPIAWHFGAYRAIFRSAGSGMMITLALCISIVTLPMLAIFMIKGVAGVPRTVAVIQPMTFFLLLTLSRIVARYLLVDLLNQRNFAGEGRRTLIYGAGNAGQQLASSIRFEPGMTLLGFIDDDPRLHGHRINRLPIDHPKNLDALIIRHGITDLFLALPQVSRGRRKRIVDELQKFPIHVRTLPAMREIVDGHVSVSHLREVEIEDLLGRDPVAPDQQLLEETIRDKVVMVTGAGGSIGSELCRQIVRLMPKALILAENSEYSLYAIEQELRSHTVAGAIDPLLIVSELVNVADPDAIMRVMVHRRPDTVYHAAAYKHVPLVEANVVSGTHNNVFGTLNTAIAAERIGVRNFVLISTDKAVRPTNVMGASKRVCELILQAFSAAGSKTVFSIVRFGNVLGSSGSVVPLFKQQIREGGPVTLTDKRITRFFMTIPEASQLVIQSGGMARGGEVYVLDMGKSVKIIDFAQSMIRLSGMSVRDDINPDGDIEIVEIGLRPGEKLYEELLIGDNAKPTQHKRIMQAHEEYLDMDLLNRYLDDLRSVLRKGQREAVISILHELVPEFGGPKIHAAPMDAPDRVIAG